MNINHKKALTTKDALTPNQKIEKRQQEIDDYNFKECMELDPKLSHTMLTGEDVVVRLHKENYIKSITSLAADETTYECWISQVDGRMRKTDPERWVDNPLPYINRGVIVYLSPQAKIFFKKIKKDLEAVDKNIAKTFKLPQVGDVVSLDHFMLADYRYYPNKQQRDFIRNPEEWRIVHWEGYVKIHPTQIEGVYKELSDVYKTSPFYMLKNAENESK